MIRDPKSSHNPYFNRWFSAMSDDDNIVNVNGVTILILIDGFLQSKKSKDCKEMQSSHNPYFNRWFSAIKIKYDKRLFWEVSQSLF